MCGTFSLHCPACLACGNIVDNFHLQSR
jgi:hypothetical protein